MMYQPFYDDFLYLKMIFYLQNLGFSQARLGRINQIFKKKKNWETMSFFSMTMNVKWHDSCFNQTFQSDIFHRPSRS